MSKRVKYLLGIYNKFGVRAIIFLLVSKFKHNRLCNIRIKNIKAPISLSNFNADVMTFFQIFYGGEYDMPTNHSISHIIDCGANIGLSAVFFASKYPKSTIIAIEPDKNNFYYLKQNTASFKNVTCLNKAVWPYPAKMNIVENGTGNWGLQTVEAVSEDHETVDGISIDEIIREFKIDSIDLLKIDIEGAEKELFSKNYESWLKQTKLLTIELHDNVLTNASDAFFKAVESLAHRKYYLGENLVCDFT